MNFDQLDDQMSNNVFLSAVGIESLFFHPYSWKLGVSSLNEMEFTQHKTEVRSESEQKMSVSCPKS